MNRRKKRNKGLIIISFILIIIIVIGVSIYLFFFRNNPNKPIVLKEIEGYGYTLEKRDTKLMANTYNELENILASDSIDYQKYAETLSKLFVIDLYTISNKVDTYDVGGLEYIYPEDAQEYKYNVMGTLYDYIGYIDDRDIKLPEVKSIESVKSKEATFVYNEESYDAYVVNITWKYTKDLGYDDKAQVTVFKKDDKLYIGEFITGEAQDE